MNEIILAAIFVGVTGIVIGLLLGFAGKKFAVEVDEKEIRVREELPGNNCGGCGYAGCDGLAKAIAAGQAAVNACPVGGEAVAKNIGQIMGVSADAEERKVAFVACDGTCEKAIRKYDYFGISDCVSAMSVPGAGDKGCTYGCLGLGSCVKECPFDAIYVINGVAVVDKEKCKACGKCVAICPKKLISLVPEKATALVYCSSHYTAKKVMENCKVGCRGCSLCAKNCPEAAITMDNFLAVIDQDKCSHCGICEQKCPAKTIHK